MSAREIVARIAATVSVAAQRAGFGQAKHPPEPSVFKVDCFLETDPVVDPERYLAAADSVLDGHLQIFGIVDEGLGSTSYWNTDPKTGVCAPNQYWASIEVNSKEIVGDIKYLWEKNRHLHLVCLAQAFRISGKKKYLVGIRTHLDTWFEQCPYLSGPNWASGLELAIRIINWSITWQLIGAERSELFKNPDGQDFRDRWLRSVYQHVHFIDSHYSRFSSANNHLIGEAAGVFVASCTWPFWENAKGWRARSRSLLIQAARDQVAMDGVGREQAIGYQQFVLDFLILSGLAGRANGADLPKEYWETIESMIEFVKEIMDVKGNLPMIGDADDGYVVCLSQEKDFCPFKSLLTTGAILFERSDFAEKSAELDDKTRYLLGQETFLDLRKKSTPRSHKKVRKFPDGGYYILGQDFGTESEIFLLADAGPLGYLSIAAHGHSDALAVYLSVAGREFLIDPGTYTYHGSADWRRYFRSTRAHNTLVVDEQDQSVQGGLFLWTRHANVTCTKFECGAKSDTFKGEHDGYSRLPDPVVHQREIVRAGTIFSVTDTLRCNGRHLIERCWHFSENCDVTLKGSSVIVENQGVTVKLAAEEPSTRIVTLTGSDKPKGGWVSRRFDEKIPSTSVYFINSINGTSVVRASIECQLA